MSKQQQAPGDLELVRAFVNTVDIEQDAEEFDSPAALTAWLVANRLAPRGAVSATAADLRHAVELREALRAVLLAHNGGAHVPPAVADTLDAAAVRARVRLHFGDGAAAHLEPEAEGVDAALGRLLSIVHSAMAQGTWPRLKACRDHACEWAFYDHTKNRSGAWCNMRVCGNRAKARAFRQRRAADGAGTDARAQDA
jgi:predicted RNA-binding Zn ribbon-like protein